MGYNSSRTKIQQTLTGRTSGTQVTPDSHQAMAEAVLNYVKEVENISLSGLEGIAYTDTTPVQPDKANCAYISAVPSNTTYTYKNFADENGDAVSITATTDPLFVILFWNKKYWSYLATTSAPHLHVSAELTDSNDEVPSSKAVSDYVVNLISTKTVFDISAYHATGGTLATYDNLEDALGTNGKNIPQSLRKGGMSVKFVQTSDNKYVQYRLMAQNFSTTVTDWQGVDDEPIAGSEDIIKSNAVESGLNTKISKDIGVNLVDPSQCSRGVINNSDGSIDTSSWIKNIYQISGFIPVNGKNIIGHHLLCAPPFSGGNVYDINKHFIRTIGFTNQYTYQSGDYYVRLSFSNINFTTRFPYANYGTTLLPYESYTETNGIDNKLDDIKRDMSAFNINNVYNGSTVVQLAQSYDFIQGQSGIPDYQITDRTLIIGSNRRDEYVICKIIRPDMGKYLYISFNIRNTQNHQSDFDMWCSPDFKFHDNTFPFGKISLEANETRKVELQLDLAHLVVYKNYTDGLSLWLQPQSYNSQYGEVEITDFRLYQLNNQKNFENFGGKDLPSILDSIDEFASLITPSALNNKVFVAPNGEKYILSVNSQGQFVSIPLYPDNVTYIGNSLLSGSGFGMAASDKYHDYFYLINEFLKTKEPLLEVSQRIHVGNFETADSVQAAQNAADSIIELVSNSTKLVFIQCGDNVPVANYETIFLPGLLYLVQGIRTKATSARIILIASWYGNVTSIMTTVAAERGADFISISNIPNGETMNHVGAIQTFDVSKSRTISNVTNVTELTNDKQDYNYKITVTFTVASSSYTTTFYCNSYSLSDTTLTYTSNQSVITNAGIASHPNDLGFKRIANKILYSGKFVDTEEYYSE